MNRPFLLMLFSIYFSHVFSQDTNEKYLPEIKAGTILNYTFKGKDGNGIEVTAEIISTEKGGLVFTDTIKFGNKVQVNKTVISKPAMENATKMKAANEQATSSQNGLSLFVLPDDKTDHCFSRHFFKLIKEQKSATYSGITYNLSTPAANEVFTINDKIADAIYIVSSNGQKKFWILNNPLYPFILKSESENIHAELTALHYK